MIVAAALARSCMRVRRKQGCRISHQGLTFAPHRIMSESNPTLPENAEPAPQDRAAAGTPPAAKPAEHGGRDGLDPVRYGDWEKDGRCIDF
jgi:hypothetical protein